MGRSEQPYLYDPPTSRQSIAYPYSDFNPKAATQASYTALAERAERQRFRASQAGKPLINFNQHPDSYQVVSGQNSGHEPMPKNTKKAVTVTRWVQFVLRCFQEVGAVAALGAFVCLKVPLDALGWIVRVAPAYDILVTLYAIYHLARPAKSRPPASSSSYHGFATLMDVGLVPFYIYMFLSSMYNLNQPIDSSVRWASLFKPVEAATILTSIAMYTSIVMVGLHTISIAFDIYLIVVFNRIASLPPDMNPLEDNLTSRPQRSFKHKYKNSEATLVGEDFDEKVRHSHLSGNTLSDINQSRSSLPKATESRSMPFAHTRMGSELSFSPHNPASARYSQLQMDQMSVYHDARSARSSRQDLSAHVDSRSRSASPTKLSSFVEILDIPRPPTTKDRTMTRRPDSTVSSHEQRLSAQPTLPILAPVTNEERAHQRRGLLSDNWYTMEDDEVADLSNHRQRKPLPYSDAAPDFLRHDRHDSLDPEPLRMNPPTPPPPIVAPFPNAEDDETLHVALHTAGAQHSRPDAVHATVPAASSEVARTGTILSQTSSVYSDASDTTLRPANATPKGRYYGDLAAATRGVLGSRSSSPQKETRGTAARVVSRSGVDLADGGRMDLEGEAGASMVKGGRRQVSGKVMEEGRGWELWRR